MKICAPNILIPLEMDKMQCEIARLQSKMDKIPPKMFKLQGEFVDFALVFVVYNLRADIFMSLKMRGNYNKTGRFAVFIVFSDI